jgi:hypothetical protein
VAPEHGVFPDLSRHMEITTPGQSLSAITLTAPPLVTRAWQTGQLLQAIVLEPSSGKSGTATLQIQDIVVKAQTTLPLMEGQRIQLQVVQAGEKPVLKLITPATEMDVLAQALRTALPKSGSLAPLMTGLAALAQTAPKQSTDVPPRIMDLARQILAQLPTTEQVTTADGLKQALRDSGVFFENKLVPQNLTGGQTILTDLKGLLLRLVNDLRGELPAPNPSANTRNPVLDSQAMKPNTPYAQSQVMADPREMIQRLVDGPRVTNPSASQLAAATTATPTMVALQSLTDKTDAALAHIQTNQIQSLTTENTAKPMWAMDIPIRQNNQTDVFSLKIQRDEKEHGDRPELHRWSVWLDFDLEVLGPARAVVNVYDRQVSVGLWAEHGDTVTLFNNFLAILHSDLTSAGLSVGRLQCQKGISHSAPAPGTPRSILNEKA